jgi:protein gp37
MADHTTIEWTDATVNFWWGCTKVGPGCDHCYAETWDKRTGGAHWGHGSPRRWIKGAANTLTRLNRQGGKRVFIQSMSDLFDNDVETAWFLAAWLRIAAATDCRVQIVTKRISMVEKRLAEIGAKGWPRHAGLMITVCNQTEADRDIPRLLALKAKLGIPWVGLSMEPLLGPVDLERVYMDHIDHAFGTSADLHGLDWVIVGGESGPGARPMHPDWARSLRDQCQAAGVAFFMKQMSGAQKSNMPPIPSDLMVREFHDAR